MIETPNKQLTQLGLKQPSLNRIPVHPWNRRRKTLVMTFIVLSLISLYELMTMSTGNVVLPTAFKTLGQNMTLIFLQPKLTGSDTFTQLLRSLLDSVALATLTTLLGALCSFFAGLLAASNLTNPKIGTMIRTIMAIIRAIPTILWVLIFSIVIGLGADAAVIGLSFHSFAYLTKAYSESFETLDKETIESLKAMGASWWQIVFQAVLPSSIAALLSWTFIRFEINFTNAIAVGAAAGAGGIGYQLFTASGFYYDFHEVGVIVYLCLAVTACLEFVSVELQKRYIHH
ncbi:PhnE/PtxC family ABC transporter permease [Latilactobacillus curvatus]|uniref:PhnE/PtxC family ABC transporter permease n=1 Tax=Latilactobacillus curvatus TaxID=28038 RepID=UPI000FECA461|nr:ABC transporter permease subunit [Latilactobacillus curvatus]QAR34852.1 ABC transporter permease subunit [Latilactobacillus curvatus]